MILLHFWLPFVGCPASAVTVHLAVNLSYDHPYCLLMVCYAENERWKKKSLSSVFNVTNSNE